MEVVFLSIVFSCVFLELMGEISLLFFVFFVNEAKSGDEQRPQFVLNLSIVERKPKNAQICLSIFFFCYVEIITNSPARCTAAIKANYSRAVHSTVHEFSYVFVRFCLTGLPGHRSEKITVSRC